MKFVHFFPILILGTTAHLIGMHNKSDALLQYATHNQVEYDARIDDDNSYAEQRLKETFGVHAGDEYIELMKALKHNNIDELQSFLKSRAEQIEQIRNGNNVTDAELSPMGEALDRVIHDTVMTPFAFAIANHCSKEILEHLINAYKAEKIDFCEYYIIEGFSNNNFESPYRKAIEAAIIFRNDSAIELLFKHVPNITEKFSEAEYAHTLKLILTHLFDKTAKTVSPEILEKRIKLFERIALDCPRIDQITLQDPCNTTNEQTLKVDEYIHLIQQLGHINTDTENRLINYLKHPYFNDVILEAMLTFNVSRVQNLLSKGFKAEKYITMLLPVIPIFYLTLSKKSISITNPKTKEIKNFDSNFEALPLQYQVPIKLLETLDKQGIDIYQDLFPTLCASKGILCNPQDTTISITKALQVFKQTQTKDNPLEHAIFGANFPIANQLVALGERLVLDPENILSQALFGKLEFKKTTDRHEYLETMRWIIGHIYAFDDYGTPEKRFEITKKLFFSMHPKLQKDLFRSANHITQGAGSTVNANPGFFNFCLELSKNNLNPS